ncbi:hypothetical protein Csa_007705 [Cucumis sativus]|uniref:Uncharacterized protein n=1 Tax=Cucumis sativus TaxID=3659 RepID=A0A0A0M1L2_CUCSA|nr:hypothetical protein Csa_007705 [Cucumis sativus]
MIKELRKDRATLIMEELDLLNIVNKENMKRYKSLIVNAKKPSSQYKKEAENCTNRVRTCEEARERAQEKLVEECKLTALWQKRAEMLAKP